MSNYEFKAVEESILAFWDAQEIKKKLEQRNKGGEKFYFLDGPPYTSGAIHLGHAWNKAAKDMVLRYKRAKGFDVFDRAGYDMHGLPTENKVQAAHNLTCKEDVEKFGVDKFIEECIKFSNEKADDMNKDFKRIGVWMDFENAYRPVNNSYMSNIWWLVKRANDEGRLYEAKKTMMWDAVGETALAKHETEYKSVTDQAIFVRFKVVGVENEYLVIWTTTPWTIPFNLAIMVNPTVTYVKLQVEDKIYIVAKDLVKDFAKRLKIDEDLDIVSEVNGIDLEGWKYEHPFANEIDYKSIEKDSPKTHTVVLSKDFVTTQCGTGLVHCAPGCGPEDYIVGHENGLPAFNILKEDGSFGDDAGNFSGLKAKENDSDFIKLLGDEVVAKQTYKHDYPYSERTKSPVVFRATKQWFFRVEDLKENMVEANKDIHWVPQSGKNAFNSWLENLRDNSITKQRFFGTPVPIWKNIEDEEDFIVVGSHAELEELAGKKVENLHKPFIDEVVIQKDGKTYKRILDVLDVWIDAGSASWNSLDYPMDESKFDMFPADFILEGKDQIRGWFNLLMVGSMLTVKKASFKNVFMHGFITDFEGEKMSKSLGNIVSPYEVIDKFGADTLRIYTVQNTAGEDMSFAWDEVKLKNRNLQVLWNVHNWLIDFANTNDLTVTGNLNVKPQGLAEKYIVSKLFSTIKSVTAHMENYELHKVPSLIEELFLELSRTYIQFIREKSVLGSKEEKQTIFDTVLLVVTETLKMLSLVCPFVSEQIYQNLKSNFDFTEESITHFEWPHVEDALIDEDIEDIFYNGGNIIQSILANRERAKLGVRWPIGEVVVEGNENVINAAKTMEDLIKVQTNVKKLTITDRFDQANEEVKPNFAKIGPQFGKIASKIVKHVTDLPREEILVGDENMTFEIDGEEVTLTQEHFIFTKTVSEQWIIGQIRGGYTYLDTLRSKELDAEGYSRELMRRIQDLRKESGKEKTDEIKLQVSGQSEFIEMIKEHVESIADKCGCSRIEFVEVIQSENKKEDKIKGYEFSIGF